eukprot:Gb_26084 [translate_table: standard]
MEEPNSSRLTTNFFGTSPFRSRPSRKRDSLSIYGYTVACVLVLILLQFWAFAKKPEWFLFKWERPVNDNYTVIASAKKLFANNETENLKHDIAAMCLPKTFYDRDDKLELTTAEVRCLRKALLDKHAQKQTSHDTHTRNAIVNVINGGMTNVLASELQQNNCSQNVTTETEALKHENKVLKFELKAMEDQVRESVTFLPLKDTRFTDTKDPDRTWFMSTLRGNSENGNPEYFYFPSETSKQRILCVKGRHPTDGTRNLYGFAWQKHLPPNSILLPGLTFVSDNYYDYRNPWHSMTALVGFAGWQKENECALPERFVLYHWGELVKTMGSWISNIMHAALGHRIDVDSLEYGDGTVCFEKAVVYRQGLGRMALDKRIALFDMIRCKVRKFCNVLEGQRFVDGIQVTNLTLLARTGSRSFKNESIVAGILEKECKMVAGCNFRFVQIANLSFCDQVSVMSTTDILATVHGAQLTDMIFMRKGSSVMEMFPKGWLEFAGNGQFVFHWLASWSGMYHEGTWHDTEGPLCPIPVKGPLECFSFHKDSQVGHNETFFSSWTAEVLQKFQNRTMHLITNALNKEFESGTCPCDHANAV